MESAIVRKLQVFCALSQDDKDLLVECTKNRRSLEAGHDLIKEGETSRDVYVVLAGIACRYKSFQDGRRQIVGLLVPGDLCDVHSFILRAMDHSIGTITKTDYVRLKPHDMKRLLERPHLAQALAKSSIAEASVLRAWLANIGQQPAYNRLAHFLCEMYHRLDIVGLANDLHFDLGLNQSGLGECLGLTAVHINRSVVQLKQAGLIDYKRKGGVRILDLDGLMAVGSFQPDYLHFHRIDAAHHAA